MTLLRNLAWLVLAALPLAASAHDGKDIVAQNPQLAKIPDWPAPSKNTGAISKPFDCNTCAAGQNLDSMRRQGYTAYRCVSYEGQFGGKAYESGSGEMKRYVLQLFPGTPKVWRVYPQGGYTEDAKANLIAEFDASGKLLSSKSARSPLVKDHKGPGRGAGYCVGAKDAAPPNGQ
jgi:hypothetical protein